MGCDVLEVPRELSDEVRARGPYRHHQLHLGLAGRWDDGLDFEVVTLGFRKTQGVADRYDLGARDGLAHDEHQQCQECGSHGVRCSARLG